MPAEKREELKPSGQRLRPLGLLLSQLGTHAALTFGRKIKGCGISPPHVGILRKFQFTGLYAVSRAEPGRRFIQFVAAAHPVSDKANR